mmetsp:Transcript_20501/g.44399  ORF Transcript_20501/g.44399 Transcript_20501/m.44399 type:complete len:233 (+) Transcript_20501:167-865(+)|eukprot:CAMPEP_0168743786 /NCGR_PEP_ID=MMETSP0724-20121128/13757_1 /TAXON_ID=265536 /ORGANISM="Amphiprora sp., Strain CCMP467" /LENGTH=232 /DNA_ID=CAMNT_0008791429 /DNA_START=151 /DNA_END=849 /DNA_ORIENTATION=+
MKFDLTFLVQDDAKDTRPSKKNNDTMKEMSLFDLTLPTLRQSVGSSSHSSTTSSLHLPPPPAPSSESASAGSYRSASIPLPESHIERTHSELQLCLDEAAAEQREILMFYRVVNGIRDRQQKLMADLPLPPNTATTTRRSLVRNRSTSFPSIVPQDDYNVADNHHDYHHHYEQRTTHSSFPVSSSEAAGEWSIGGYYGEAPQQGNVAAQGSPSPFEDASSPTEDQGIFDMEL